MTYKSYDNLPPITYKDTFGNKSPETQKLIQEALQILLCLRIPIDEMTPRQKEKTAMALLAVGDVKKSSEWKKIKDSRKPYAPTTRKIIDFYNRYLEEDLSSGSYDDVRRKDLKYMLVCEIVRQSSPEANSNDPTRGYQINPEYARIIRNYGQTDWFEQVESFNKSHKSYEERVASSRNIPMLSVTTPDGRPFELKDGEHNAIQKAIIEEFLPRFGYDAEVLYCGDTNNKYGIIYEKDRLKSIGFRDLKGNTLPDVVAYSRDKDWVFLIEAYHSSNPITPLRKYSLLESLGCSANKVVFVTAFENMQSYRSCPEDLAWETEVWIATVPEHLIHLDGGRFLGPYSDEASQQQ